MYTIVIEGQTKRNTHIKATVILVNDMILMVFIVWLKCTLHLSCDRCTNQPILLHVWDYVCLFTVYSPKQGELFLRKHKQ